MTGATESALRYNGGKGPEYLAEAVFTDPNLRSRLISRAQRLSNRRSREIQQNNCHQGKHPLTYPENDCLANEISAREANEWIEQMGVDFGLDDAASQYVCECSAPGCKQTVSLTHTEYEWVRSEGRRFVICLDHENPELDIVTGERDGWAVIETVPGVPSRAAQDSDPRRGGPKR